MLRLLCFASLAFLLPSYVLADPIGSPLVGFVNHFPFVDTGMDQVVGSGSNAVIFRAVGHQIEAQEGKLNFDTVDRQIDYAEKNNLKIILLIEGNPIYSPEWLKQKCTAAGEMQMTVMGKPDSMPSMTSPIFKQWHERFVRAVTEHVKQRDKTGVIVAYQPGAEWWYDASGRYNPGDMSEYRKWLNARYGSISKLNTAWESDYASFNEVEPCHLVMESALGRRDKLAAFVPGTTVLHDVSWSTHQDVPITPGKEYTFRARLRTRDLQGDGAHLELAWRRGGGGVPLATVYSQRFTDNSDWREVSLTASAPKDATTAWLLLKLRGNGKVDYDDVFFGEKGSDVNLAPNPGMEQGTDTPESYFFDNWTQSSAAKSSYAKENGNRYLSISVSRDEPGSPHWKNWSEVCYDWSMFSYNFLGDYIESFCRLVKEGDPSRPTVGYLTFSFAFPMEWDYVQQSSMALDVILPKLKHLDVIGMQICSADGDPIRITATLDLARKYGKRVYPIDLLDFTSGVALGYPAMDRVTQCAVQHGATGAFYYCWYGTPDYNFHTGMPQEDLSRMLTSASKSMDVINGMKVETRVAVIEPILPCVYTDPNGEKNDHRDFAGLYKAVLDMQLCPDIWTVTELAEQKPDLRKNYDLIFLPDCLYCPAQAIVTISRFLNAGGKVICSGSLPVFDEIGRPLHELKLRGSANMVKLENGFGRRYLGSIQRTTHAGNTPPLFLESDKAEAQTERRRGMLTQLAGVLDSCGFDRVVEINEPGVACTIFAKDDLRVLYLTNASSKKQFESVKLDIPEQYDLLKMDGGNITGYRDTGDEMKSTIDFAPSGPALIFLKARR